MLPDNINHTEDYKVYENSIHFDNNNKKNFTEYTSKNCYITHIRNITYDSKMIEYKKLILDICQKSCIDYNFSEIRPSTIVSTEDLLHSGHLPSFEDNLYKIDDNNYLIPTSEVSIFGYIINDILTKQEISEYKIFALTDCYRKENSATSKFNKPLIRQSCFEKNETFILCHKDNEINSFNLMIENVKNTLNKLNLKYRIINVCPKEMSKNAFIQYDFEVFFPSVQDYIEVSSVSLCINHQIMRSPIYKIAQHYSTLNASCLPINRIIAALIDYNK
ncbi:Serine--tRNA ligase [bacterium AB1]|nr:Serine--tRNA ligase [bacterium AB1]